MASPFPGMDPYLEPYWQEVHQTLCTYARDLLNERLGNGLRASIDERIVLEEFGVSGGDRSIRPDVGVVAPFLSGGTATREAAGGATAVLKPQAVEAEQVAPVELRLEEVRQPFVEVRETIDGRLLTTIEFVSPSNKRRGDAGQQYEEKQHALRRGNVSLVEIDLTRGGERRLLAHEAGFANRAQAREPTYFASVYRSWHRRRVTAYPIPLAAVLPDMPVPTREADDEVLLPLQAFAVRAYANGRYEQVIDFAKPPRPPLSDADAAVAERLVARHREGRQPS